MTGSMSARDHGDRHRRGAPTRCVEWSSPAEFGDLRQLTGMVRLGRDERDPPPVPDRGTAPRLEAWTPSEKVPSVLFVGFP